MSETVSVEPEGSTTITVTINGTPVTADVSPRLLLSDFLRHQVRLTGTHVGCEHGVCGACTIHIDGQPTRSCLTLAVQADGTDVTTVEGLAVSEEQLHPVQEAFRECHALQCGFCTPGFMMSIAGLLEERDVLSLSDDEIREEISGNLCRCTGYMNIVAAVRRSAEIAAKE